MAKLGAAEVDIRANLKPLRAGLKMAKDVVKKAMKAIVAVVKKAMSVAIKWAKRLGVAIVAAHTAATWAAIKQEAAEIELASALKRSGEYSESTMQSMKDYAAALQLVTTSGDEENLMLMRQAMTLGLTAEQSKGAAKAAISLFAGFASGRGKPAIFMRYYVETLNDAGSSLASFVNGLRTATTYEEKMIVLQKAVAEGWGVAKSKAESAGGALEQVKNIIGDIGEAYGQHFLPAFQGMRDWFNENKITMMKWAEYTAVATLAVIGALKDVGIYIFRLEEYLEVAKDISTESMEAAWAMIRETILTGISMLKKLFVGMGKSLAIIFEKIGFDIVDFLTLPLSKAASKIDWWVAYLKESARLMFTMTDIGDVKPLAKKYADELQSTAKDSGFYKNKFGTDRDTGTWGDTMSKANAPMKTAVAEITAQANDLANTLGKMSALWAANTGIPEEAKNIVKDHIKAAKDKIAKIDAKYAAMVLKDPTSLTGLGGGGDGVTTKGKGKNGFGFTGITDAWSTFVSSMSQKDPNAKVVTEIKNLINVTEEGNDIMKRQNQGVSR